MAADDVIIEGNIISNNKTAGIIINDHSYASTITMDQDSDPNADRTMILDNVMLNNGYDTIARGHRPSSDRIAYRRWWI